MKRSFALGIGLLALVVLGWSLVAGLTAQAAVLQAGCFICRGASEALNNILNAAGALAAGGLAAGAALGNGALNAGSAMGNAAVGAGRAATDTTLAAGSAMPEVLADTVLSSVIGPGVTTDTLSGIPSVPSTVARGVANAPRVAADGARVLADLADGAADLAENAADAAEAAGRAAVDEFTNDSDEGGSGAPLSGGGGAPP